MTKARTWTVDGVTKTTSGWATYCGTTHDNMYAYFAKYTPEEAVFRAKNGINGRIITYNGETMNLTGWAEKLGVDRKTLSKRIASGCPIEDVLSPNKLRRGKHKDEGLGRRMMAEKRKNGEYQEWIDGIDKSLKRMENKGNLRFKVRWCDRTSHSHSWRETMVERSDLEYFMNTHYLSKVVIQWS